MNAVREMIARTERAREAIDSGAMAQEVILEHEAEIIDMNTAQLYDKGVYSDGLEIARIMPYSKRTIALKKATGLPYNRVTLFQEGDFHSRFNVVADLEGFRIGSSDPKTSSLAFRYGSEIFGLTDENKREVNSEFLLPGLKDKLKQIINGKD